MTYQQKLTLIETTLNAVMRDQISTMAKQLKDAQTQTNRLEKQYGKGRRS